MTLQPDVVEFIMSLRQKTCGLRADARITDSEIEWHAGYLHGVVQGVAVMLGRSADDVLDALPRSPAASA